MTTADTDGLRWVDIADGTLRGDPTNPRNNEGSIAPIAASIRRFGFGAPVVARPDPDRPGADGELGGLVVIAGHTRLAAAVAAGIERVPVRVLDVTEAEGRALMLADNKLAEAATWNDDGLADLLGDLQEGGVDLDGLGWDETEIADLLGGGGVGGGGGGGGPGNDDDEVETLFRTGLHNLATGLCQQANGAADPWVRADVQTTIRYLEKRLKGWKPAIPRQSVRDAAMREYVEAAMAEWRAGREGD